MPLPRLLHNRLAIPAIVMCADAVPDAVIEACRGGVICILYAHHSGTSGGLEEAVSHIQLGLSESDAPFAVRLVVHATNPRFAEDFAICVEHEVEIVITAHGVDRDVVEQVHGYGGIVFHEVASVQQAQAAIRAGVDGVILAAGVAGANPFALLPEIRGTFNGAIVLAGSIHDGSGVAAARMLGADLACVDEVSPTPAWCERLVRQYTSAVESACVA